MEKFPMMLYRLGGSLKLDLGMFTVLTVTSEEERAAALLQGWFERQEEAVQAEAEHQAKLAAEAEAARQKALNAPPTRPELEAAAAELGVEFKPSTTDAALLKLVNAAAAAKQT